MALTQEQKNMIVEYRGNGIGYKHIATLIGAKRDQVRAVCASKGLIGLYGKQNATAEYTCKSCGKKYPIKNGLSLAYCSIECKEAGKILKHKMTIKKKTFICKTCGKEFIRNGSQVYCSKECRYEDRECDVCGKIFTVKIDSEVVCCSLKCAKHKTKKSHEQYYKEFSNVHKGRIVPITVYNGLSKDMTVYCIECGKTTTRSADKFVSRRIGCRSCGRKLSTGEDAIKVWLEDNQVKYVSQYTPKDSLLVFKLRYDFALLNEDGSVNALIEYNGRQHYEPVESFGGEDEFKKQIESDSAKEWYAKDRGILFVKISYKEKKELESILSSATK